MNFTEKDIDRDRITRLVGEHASAMASSVGLGSQLSDSRKAIKALEQRKREIETHQTNHASNVTEKMIAEIANIKSQINTGNDIHSRINAQRATAITQASSLSSLLTRLRSDLLKAGIEINALDRFGSGDSTVGISA